VPTMPQSLSVLVPSSGERQAISRLITRVACRWHLAVMMGESGTGKGLAARAIHAQVQGALGPLCLWTVAR
jgi:DNA-binding NtrC family response regulator